MVTTPAALPVTMPPVPIDAIDILLLVHTPDGVTSDNVVVWPTHILVAPLIADTTGNALTVTTVVVLQPVLKEYVIVELPGPTPETTPLVAPIVATPGEALLHVPPPASVSVTLPPTHIGALPDMADGFALTVTPLVENAVQPALVTV